MKELQSLSLLFLIIYFVLLVGGIFYTRKNKDSVDYFLGGRKLPFWSISIAFIASWWGAGSAIETADKAYNEGISAFMIYGMPVLFSSFMIYLFSKAIRKIGTITQPQLLEERYGKFAAYLLSILIFIFMTVSAAGQMVAIGDFFDTFLGINYTWGVIIGTAIVVLYSSVGGFRGVVITDIIQFIFLLITSLLLFGIAYYHSGGWSNIQDIALSNNKPNYNDITNGFSKNIIYVITFGTAWMIQANVWQRISATRTPGDAKKMIGTSFITFIPLYLMVTLTGMFALGLFDKMPEEGIIMGIITNYMSPVLGALMFIGISSAVMSTMDSLINTGALVLSVDIHKKIKKDKLSSKQLVLSGKASTLIVSLIAIIIGLRIRSILDVSWIAADFIATGAFVPIVLGFLWKRGNHKAAIASMIFGIIFPTYNLLISLGIDLPSAWEHESAEQVLIGMFGSLVLYIIVSIFTKANQLKASKFIRKAELIKSKAS